MNTTYRIDTPCPQVEPITGETDPSPCHVTEMDHYGVPTGILYCQTHSTVVGSVGA